ncbi:MAG: hypothetical protein WC815_23835 [Vicinamibacterales bacterium]|jgi:hypothetical protein
MNRVDLFNDHFQNYKQYGIPKAQLIIADIPYNVGINAYGSNPQWYVDGDNANGAGSGYTGDDGTPLYWIDEGCPCMRGG